MEEDEKEENDDIELDYASVQMRQEPHLIRQIFYIQKSLNRESKDVTDLNYKISMFIMNLEMLEDMCLNNGESTTVTKEDVYKDNQETGKKELLEKSYEHLVREYKESEDYKNSKNKSYDLARYRFRLLYGSLFSGGTIRTPLRIK